MKTYLNYKAGPAILHMIRQDGLDPARIRVLACPAGGPKWFVCVGFDRALMRRHLLERASSRVLLAGASAGAWRCLTMVCRNPLEAHERLRIAYSRNRFSRTDTPCTIGEALRRNVDAFVQDPDIAFILNHPRFDVAVHVVRGRGPAGSESKKIEGCGLIAAAMLNALSPRGMDLFYERLVFYSGQVTPEFTKGPFRGRSFRLSAQNLRQVALATGSLPYIVSGVSGIPGAEAGVYRDGGLTDYQLNQDYCPGEDGVTLFFHYQERIVPGWFDKSFSWRRPPKGALDRVLQVHPSQRFIELLPDRKLPDRNDFIEYVDNPEERIRRWDKVSEISEILGEEFLNAVESGRIRNQVQPLE
ncbi:MAG: hypothetical protein FJY85_05130 [Deltaproteobacteria bacterium]|nr:hypothetical protein [Deltaproteobacteria bacterium]